jgi:hypothetical protein
MAHIIIWLDPGHLTNPDLDIRYVLPDLLAERSGGLIKDDGYDYASDRRALLLFLKTDNVEESLPYVIDVIEYVPVLDNRLAPAATIAVACSDGDEVVFPKEFKGKFPR